MRQSRHSGSNGRERERYKVNLSTAIERGISIRPGQTKLATVWGESSSVLGALVEGAKGMRLEDGTPFTEVFREACRLYPSLRFKTIKCPMGEKGRSGTNHIEANIFIILEHLASSSAHKFTRQLVAQWLRSEGL